MHPWKFYHGLVFFLPILAATGFAADQAAVVSPSNPNVIFFAVDDMNDWSEPLGSKMAKTPNMDRLAKMGVTFTNAHTAGIYCAPSRAAIFTGRYASTTGCYSDHGYGHGEKGNWGKHTLWQRTSNVPFLWAGPGIAENAKSEYTATLIDMYPTLAKMCDLPKDPEHDGQSLTSVLKDSSQNGTRSVFLPHDHPGSYAMINRDWRYIYYKDGTEELYDLKADFHEWNNLAGNIEYAGIKKELKALAPASFAPPATSKKELKMVVDGDSFRWISKKN